MKTYLAFGEEKSLKDWSNDPRCNCKFYTLKTRIYYGYSMKEALSFRHSSKIHEAFGFKKTLKQWSVDKRCKCNYLNLYSRINMGWSIEKAISEPICEFRRTSDVSSYFGKTLNNIKIISRKNQQKNARRVIVNCECLLCGNMFASEFGAVKNGTRKSCSCVRRNKGSRSLAWAGHGEISKSVFSTIKSGAKLRSLEFDITIEQVWDLFLKQDRKCAISGKILYLPKTRRDSDYNASLDRKNSFQGYFIDNIQWVDRKINFAKQQLSDEEFFQMCSDVYKFQKQKS